MTQEMILLAAQYARGSGAPMMATGRILSDWHKAGISTPEAARAEHEAHVRAAKPALPAAAAPRAQDAFVHHHYTADDYQRMVVDLDEEDDGC